MTILAAELPDLSLSLSVPDAGGCDITKPNPVDQRLDSEVNQLNVDWHKVARYALTLSSDGDWNDKTTVAEWLTYAEATRLQNEMGAALLIKKGGIRRWADASYGISLHTPQIMKGNKASVGDLLLHEQVIPHGEFSLSGSYVVRQFLVAAEVTAVTSGGRILSYRDRDGEHSKAFWRTSWRTSKPVATGQPSFAPRMRSSPSWSGISASKIPCIP